MHAIYDDVPRVSFSSAQLLALVLLQQLLHFGRLLNLALSLVVVVLIGALPELFIRKLYRVLIQDDELHRGHVRYAKW